MFSQTGQTYLSASCSQCGMYVSDRSSETTLEFSLRSDLGRTLSCSLRRRRVFRSERYKTEYKEQNAVYRRRGYTYTYDRSKERKKREKYEKNFIQNIFVLMLLSYPENVITL